jgi:peptide/nickel transport system permease protein
VIARPQPALDASGVRRLVVPLAALGALAVLALLAPVVAPAPPNAIPAEGLIAAMPPSLTHPFGTDPLGRDVLSRVLHGARVSLAIGVLSVVLAAGIGATVGAVAGWLGGAVDALCMRLVDVALAIPRVLVLLVVTTLWGALPLGGLVLLLGLTGWYDVARLVRGDVRGLREREFVLAARATGVRELRILWRHVAPHVWPTLAVTATLGVANAIALEAGLSFLGLGVQPPQASWGTIIGDSNVPGGGRWWLAVFPGLGVLTSVLACNALGDALRDAFAPRQVAA